MKYLGKITDPKDLVTKEYVDNHAGSGGVTVDTELSTTSENPVQNKVLGNLLKNVARDPDTAERHAMIDINGDSNSVGWRAKRTDTNVGVWVGIGTGGANHGVYSDVLEKWMVYSNGTNVYVNGTQFPMVTQTATCTIASGWANYSGWSNPTVRKYGNVVDFSWACTRASSSLASSTTLVTVCTIPSGYRPSRSVMLLCQGSSTAVFYCLISESGTVQVARYRNTATNSTSATYNNYTTDSWLPISATWVI